MTVLKDYDWSRFDRYIDIGGAYGSFLASLLSRHPSSRGVLFDQSQVSDCRITHVTATKKLK